MATHFFCTQDAAKYGIEEAIILWNIGFWCANNLANRRNIHDGRVWTYNTHKAFLELAPYLCPENPSIRNASYPDEDSKVKALEKENKRRCQKVRRILKSLEEQGAIVSGNYNKNKYDQTLWYSLKDQSTLTKYAEISPEAAKLLKLQICRLEVTELSNGDYKNVTPIPDSKHRSVNPKKTTTTEKPNFNDFAIVLISLIKEMIKEGGWVPAGQQAPKATWLETKARTLFDKFPDPSPEDCAVLILKDWTSLLSNQSKSD